MVVRTGVTLEELLALRGECRYEVVDGEVVAVPGTGGMHNLVAGQTYSSIDRFVREHDLGLTFTDGILFVLADEGPGLRDVRIPDAAFVRWDDAPDDWDQTLPFPGAPTLAIEVTSPSDSADDLGLKVQKYLEAGSEEVWVIWSSARVVEQIRDGGREARRYSGDEAIDTSRILPGLRLTPADIFAVRRKPNPVPRRSAP